MRLQANSRNVTWTAFLIAFCALIPILLMNGGNLFLVGDHMTQQIPFMKECRRMFLSGEPFWSHNTFLGANFLGTYSFYVYGSPFFWPLLLLPESLMGIGVSLMFIAKHAVAALTAYLFLKNHVKTPHFAMIGAWMYAFSSFSMDSSYYYHFLDVIAFFPLILYFTDQVLDNRKKPLLSLVVLLNAVTNYYFMVASSVFFLIYLVFRVKFSDGRYKWRDAWRCIVFYAIGGFASMVVLLPSFLCLLETDKATGSLGSSGWMLLLGSIESISTLDGIVLPSEGILGSGNGFVLSWFNFSSSKAFLPMFGALFFFGALRKKQKTWDYTLLKFLLIVTLVPFLNGAFSMYTMIIYTRWWYAFVLIMIVAAMHVLEDLQDRPQEEAMAEHRRSGRTLLIVAGVTFLVPLLLKVLCTYVLRDWIYSWMDPSIIGYAETTKFTTPFQWEDLRYFVVLLVLTLLSYGPLWHALKHRWIYDAKKVVPVVAVICILSYGLYLSNESQVFSVDKLATYDGADVAATEEISYHSRTQCDRTYNGQPFDNYALVSNEPGVNTFHSFKSHATTEFARLVGYRIDDAPWTPHYYTTEAIQTVLSVETLMDDDNHRTAAPYYTPFGYEYTQYILDEGYAYTTDTAENNRRVEWMTAACFVDAETAETLGDLLTPFDTTAAFDWQAACETARSTAAVAFEMTGSGFTASSVGDHERLLYFSIPHDRGWTATVNGAPTEIHTVNGGMMAVVVPAGEADIVFTFETPGLVLGAIVSAMALFGLLAYAVVAALRKRKV